MEQFVNICDILKYSEYFKSSLLELNWSGGKSQKSVDKLDELTNLKVLGLRNCQHLYNVNFLVWLTNLTELNLQGCKHLQQMNGITKSTNLKKLSLSDCGITLQNVDKLSPLKNLTSLKLKFCNLQNMKGFTNLTNLDTGKQPIPNQ